MVSEGAEAKNRGLTLKREQTDNEELRATVELLTDANRRLEHLVTELRRAIYDKRSEKRPLNDRQLAFEDLEGAVAEAEEAAAAAGAPGTSPGNRAGAAAGHRHGAPEVRLPHLRTGRDPGRRAGAPHHRRIADRGGAGAGPRLQVWGPFAAVSQMLHATFPGVIHEQLLSGPMILAHDHVETVAPAP